MSIESRKLNRAKKKRKKVILLVLLTFIAVFLVKYILEQTVFETAASEDIDITDPIGEFEDTDPDEGAPNNEMPVEEDPIIEDPIVEAPVIEVPIEGAEEYYADGKIVDNPEDILVLVNKKNYLTKDTSYEDLVLLPVYAPGRKAEAQMRQVASDAIMEFYEAAKSEANLEILPTSGYRSYDVQLSIFKRNAESKGSIELANKTSALPGQSEHQTGLAIDLSCKSTDYKIGNAFKDTEESEWTKENAHRFGFIIRYPEDKVDITGYSYEPWHLRYVGKEASKEMYERQICLEEYLEEIL
ncbi:MAG: M15 family metallopeptidase [Peptostreptococcales bacterium]